jgi:hypothetical protein
VIIVFTLLFGDVGYLIKGCMDFRYAWRGWAIEEEGLGLVSCELLVIVGYLMQGCG